VFSFEPSELHTAEEIAKIGKEYEIFFPVKDTAVDLIVAKNLIRQAKNNNSAGQS